jgi:flagellar basal-body rod protein FlgG
MSGIRAMVPAMLTQWLRHETFASNLANVSTPGFKADDLALVARDPVTLAAALPGVGVSSLGDDALMQWTDRSQGAVRLTGRRLDVALQGPGFLVVDTPAGPRYSRGGSLDVSREGYLVTAGGQQVLGTGGPILVGSDRVALGSGGDVEVDGRRVGRLRVVEFERGQRLLKSGASLFATADPAVTPALARTTDVLGGALEASNVSAVSVMVNMIDVLRKYETAQRAIQAEDETTRRVAADLGKVS